LHQTNLIQSNVTIPLQIEDTDSCLGLDRHIAIPVEIPSLPILHTVALKVAETEVAHPYTVGDMIEAELRISYTKGWAANQGKSGQLTFCYELEASAETWLIAGQRRALFTAAENETKLFSVMLLPLRAGKLLLPSVEIRPGREEDNDDDGMACEVDYESQGVAIEVVPGMSSVSLEVGMGASGGLDGEVKILDVERPGQGSIGVV
jgi:hypothetical protein